MDNTDSTLTLRDYPFGLWFFGLVVLAFGGFIFSKDPDHQWMAVVLGAGFCLLILILSSVLVIKTDRNAGTLTLTYISLFRRKVREIPLRDITSIRIETSHSHSSRGGSSPTYRVVADLADGQVVPFRSYSSSGRGGKARQAKALCDFLGMKLTNDGSLRGALNMVANRLGQEMQRQTEGPGATVEQVTDGVHWNVQALKWGPSGVTRWFSPDFQLPGGFVLLSQKPAGQKTPESGPLVSIGKALGPQMLQFFGFSAEDMPGLEGGTPLTAIDPRVDPHFAGMTSDPGTAQRVVNSYVIDALADWGQRYPIQQFQRAPIFQQLMILFSPRGVFVAAFGNIIDEAVGELRDMGVKLVKAQ
jgi:hypothetical protein